MSALDIPLPGASGGASKVGADLRAARERNGWELADVARVLRIRAGYLEAIEAGRIEDLPGTAYAVGFVRNYATALGLDRDEMARRFHAEVGELGTKTELAFPAPIPDRGVPPAVVVVFGLLIAVGGYIGWYHFADRVSGARAVAPVPAKLARLADPTVLLPSKLVPPTGSAAHPAVSPNAGAGVRAPSAPPQSGSAPAIPGSPGAGSPGAGSTSPSDVSLATSSAPPLAASPAAGKGGGGEASSLPPAAQVVARLVSLPVGLAAPGAAPASPLPNVLSPPAAAATPPVAPSVVIRASAAAWIEVRDSSGAVVFTKLMQPGESWTVPDQPGLTLTTGNAGGTQLLVNGKPTPSLGGPGVVERNQPLDAALIKAGALPAQIATGAAQPNISGTAAESRSTSATP